MQISITRALNEVKLLEKKIEKKIKSFNPVYYLIGNTVPQGYNSVDDFSNNAEADLKSINDLIDRRNMIKSKIFESNSSTKVTICGQQMTIVDVIDMKTSFQLRKNLLNRLRYCKDDVNRLDEDNTAQVNSRVDNLLSQHFSSSKDRRLSKEDINNITEPFLKKYSGKIIDPININTVIDKLDNDIMEFENNVDFILSESNAKTLIEIPD
jgi:hypothetical protein